MKCSLMAFAVMATLATSVMAQGPGAGQQRINRELTPEQREQMETRMLESIKSTDEAQYKELTELKEKDKAAFDKKMGEIRQKRMEEQRGQMETRMLEGIKAKDEAQYKELMDLKEKDKEAFDKKMGEIRQKNMEERRNQGPRGGGERPARPARPAAQP